MDPVRELNYPFSPRGPTYRLVFAVLWSVLTLQPGGPAHAGRYDALTITARWALDLYKFNISPLQGRNICNFHPTCSQFSRQAIDRYGLALGLLMTADRLERCNPYALFYLGDYYFGITAGRINDPIENHIPTLRSPAPPSDQRSVPEEKSTLEPPDQPSFAEFLFEQADYDRALGEFRRTAVSDSSLLRRTWANYLIAECWLRKRDLRAAERAFHEAMTPASYELACFGLARTLLELGRFDASRHYARLISESTLKCPARIIEAQTFWRRYQFAAGADVLRRLPLSCQDSTLTQLAACDGKSLSQRSRLVSTALSAVVPGLGQAYSGRLGDGFYSFLVVATSGFISYYYWRHPDKDPGRVKFTIAAGLAGLFYLGNVYGANIAARDYNLRANRNYLASIESLLSTRDLMPDYRQLLRP